MAENQNRVADDSSQRGKIGLPGGLPTNPNIVYQNSEQSASPNVLDQYSSYTYNITWYLVRPEDISRIMSQRSAKSLPADQIVAQSGGQGAQSRSSSFPLDYYIERMTIKTGLTGTQGVDVPTTSTELELTVMEPNGITLVRNLQQATNKLFGTSWGNYQMQNGQQSKEQINATSFFHLIVLTFYGYDEQGQPVRCGQNNSIVEKFFFTSIQTLEYRVNLKSMVEYNIKMLITSKINQSDRAVIPFNFEYSGGTVASILAGAAAGTAASDGRNSRSTPQTTKTATPQKVSDNASKNPSVRSSLVEAMNAVQQDLVKQGVYTYADKFVVEFTDQSIASAKVTVKDGTMKGTGTIPNATAAQKTDKDKQSVQSTVRQSASNAGTPVVKVIDSCVRNSTYITNQATTVVSEKTGQFTNNNSGKKTLSWYKINLQALPQKFDPKRNDFSYIFRYIVSPYKLSDMRSQYFNNPDSPGIHKRFDYMFTGKNTQVLEWEIKMSQDYRLTMSASANEKVNTTQSIVSSLALSNAGKKMYAPVSGQSSQGAAGKTNEVGASAADYLYDTSALQRVEITIIGDPAWLLQGESYNIDAALTSGEPFLSDGTINADAGQVLFELVLNTPQDYDLATGLMDPNTRSTLYKNTQNSAPGMSAQSYICRARDIISEFNNGKFTQRLTGQTLQYNPDQTVKQAQVEGRGKK